MATQRLLLPIPARTSTSNSIMLHAGENLTGADVPAVVGSIVL
jgi:hypothetical protein